MHFQKLRTHTWSTHCPAHTVSRLLLHDQHSLTHHVAVAVITFMLVVLLLYSEITYFYWPGLKFRFAPDADMHAKLKLNVDMTIAMPCDRE
jgi:hypothetical protein